MRDKGLSGTCRAALFHALLPFVPPLSGSVPEQGDSQEGGRIPVSRSFFSRGPALRLVRRLAPFGRPVPVSSRPPPLRSLSAHFSLRESAIRCADEYRTRAPCSEHRAGRTRRRAATTANCALSPSKGRAPPRRRDRKSGASPAFVRFVPRRKGRHAPPLGELRAVRKAAGEGEADAKPALSFFGAGVTAPRRSSAACRCRAGSGRSGRTAPLRCGRSDSASAPCGRIGG